MDFASKFSRRMAAFVNASTGDDTASRAALGVEHPLVDILVDLRTLAALRDLSFEDAVTQSQSVFEYEGQFSVPLLQAKMDGAQKASEAPADES